MIVAPNSRQILHVDMDAFFASVEELYDPSLRGKAVLVGAAGPRSVVCAASYEARKFGARSAMPMGMALRLCPHAVIVPIHRARYQDASAEVFRIFRDYTPLVEGLSLDEAFLDVSRSQSLFGEGKDIALRIKQRIAREVGLTASAGVANSKFVAKIASDLRKPDGLVIAPENVRDFLAPLPIARMWGVGPKSVDRFIALGLRTFRDLQEQTDAWLGRVLGDHGVMLRKLALGIDTREVIPFANAKSIGSENTYETDLAATEDLQRSILHHAQIVGARLVSEGLSAQTIQLKLKHADFSLHTKRMTLAEPVQDTQTIFEMACQMLHSLHSPGERVRLVGVSSSGLDEANRRPLLFPDVVREKRTRVDALAIAIGQKTGKCLTRATLLGESERINSATTKGHAMQGAAKGRAPDTRGSESSEPRKHEEGPAIHPSDDPYEA